MQSIFKVGNRSKHTHDGKKPFWQAFPIRIQIQDSQMKAYPCSFISGSTTQFHQFIAPSSIVEYLYGEESVYSYRQDDITFLFSVWAGRLELVHVVYS